MRPLWAFGWRSPCLHIAQCRLSRPPTQQPAIKDKSAFRASLARVMQWDFDRVVMSHGRVLETDGKAQMKKSFDFLH